MLTSSNDFNWFNYHFLLGFQFLSCFLYLFISLFLYLKSFSKTSRWDSITYGCEGFVACILNPYCVIAASFFRGILFNKYLNQLHYALNMNNALSNRRILVHQHILHIWVWDNVYGTFWDRFATLSHANSAWGMKPSHDWIDWFDCKEYDEVETCLIFFYELHHSICVK